MSRAAYEIIHSYDYRYLIGDDVNLGKTIEAGIVIEDLLTLAREGNQVNELVAVDHGDLSEDCWQNVETANATVQTPTDRTIEADRSPLAQLLENLLRNAVEYGGSDVTVTVGDFDDGFYVEDDGLGIPEDEREDVFDAVRGVVTSSDVASQSDCTTEAARQKLTRLYNKGEMDERKTGRTVVYWFTGGERITPDERPGEEVEDTSPSTVVDTEGHTPREHEDLVDAVREHLEQNDIPSKTGHGRGAVLEVLRLLREHGSMSTGDLQETVYPEYPEQWSDARTMWNAIDRYLADLPGIEKAGYAEWGYTGDEDVRAAFKSGESDVYDPTEEF